MIAVDIHLKVFFKPQDLPNVYLNEEVLSEAITENFERQTKSLGNLQRNYNQIEQEKDQYLAIFAKHNFDKLAIAKPGLMEKRFNDGTATVFGDIENDSKAISQLDAPDVP